MGEVISNRAKRERIIEDINTTATRAAAQPEGSPWAVAEGRLRPMLGLWETTLQKATAAKTAAAPVNAGLAAANATSDNVLNSVADEIWNEIGRPANDPLYELLFPGGASAYVDAPTDEQPILMELLADLLDSNLHPKAKDAAAKATRIRESAAKLGAAVEAARTPRARVKLYDRMLTAVARAAHVELVKLKRYVRSEGLSEADVHVVIPDRPRSYGTDEPDPVVES